MNEFDLVVLATDLPEHALKAGDVGTVTMVHRAGEGFEVEFMTLSGETVAVVTVAANAVRPIEQGEIAHARSVRAA